MGVLERNTERIAKAKSWYGKFSSGSSDTAVDTVKNGTIMQAIRHNQSKHQAVVQLI